jgi:hypothetical protein
MVLLILFIGVPMSSIGFSFDGENSQFLRASSKAFIPSGTLSEVLDYYGSMIDYTDVDDDSAVPSTSIFSGTYVHLLLGE